MDDSSSLVNSPARAQWIAVVAVFGAVWGAAETSLGALLRAAAVPLHGTVMAGIGVVIVLMARRILLVAGRNGRGAVLSIGFVAAALLPLSMSRGVVPAMVGIVCEAACLELVLWFGRPAAFRFAVAGLCAALVPIVQMLLWLTAQYGPAAVATFREIVLVKQGAARLGLAGQTAGILLAVALVISAAYGFVCGLVAWWVSGEVLKRLGRAAA